MGRYTSQQAFGDQQTQITKVQAASDAKAAARDPSKQGPKPHRPESIVQNTSSIAGASSAEFDVYRAARRREIERISQQEKSIEEGIEASAFAKKIDANKSKADDRTNKNAAKRKKKKDKAKVLKAMSAVKEDEDNYKNKEKDNALSGLKRELNEDSDMEDSNEDKLAATGEATSEPLTVEEEIERLLKKSKSDV